ncbi:High-affinity nicotinic acid transporter [Daldinia childiae]|uniref:High-affinity nicotinic acid transporter n=1 Tax=Daldinia childiae TaxID=326645 RepID=UPI0014453290|nr:High-affinity nicotinic acid transporter [Daldinia childiae]KAF3065913.1 High-affinity nicotinic acid transporter [Daldinia childiae]
MAEKTLDDTPGGGSGASDSEITVSGINERALLRKLDLRLLPAVGILYLLSFLDRSNVGNARIEGLLDDVHITGNQYLTGLTLYFVGYVLFEAESGLFPGVFYFSMWYKRRERQYRISLFFSAASLAGAFGGILAYGIGRMRGIVWENGWRWIFILEGILTVVVATAAYGFIHNYPDTSKFLTEDERKFIHQRLAADSDSTHEERFNWGAVVEALKDPSCWLYGLGFHTMSLPLYTLSLFLPTIISNLGYTAATAQLLTVPPYAFAFITTASVAVLSERLGQRAIFIGGSAIFAVIGYSILLGNSDPVARPGVSYVGVFFAAGGIYPASALVLSWPAINVSGQTKRAIANAMQISIGNLGAVLGTQLYRSTDGPRFIVGHSVALGYLVANAVVVTILAVRLKKENERREGITEEIKHVGEVADWQGDSDPRWRFEY